MTDVKVPKRQRGNMEITVVKERNRRSFTVDKWENGSQGEGINVVALAKWRHRLVFFHRQGTYGQRKFIPADGVSGLPLLEQSRSQSATRL